MSDYMFILESHLSSAQSRVVAAMQSLAADANVNLFLTGGAMRDMLGGFPIRDLDFSVEGNPLKMVKALTGKHGARIVATDAVRKTLELEFPMGVTAELSMCRDERYLKSGGKPQVTPATIHEDLRCRDFTINSIALSLNKASRGLLLDPNNGLADLEHHELRCISHYTLYDDPSRLLRLLRYCARLGFTMEERTKSQYHGAREAGMENKITAAALLREFRKMAEEQNSAELVRTLDAEGLLKLYSPALTGAKLNLAGLQKLHKVRQSVPPEVHFHADNMGLFLYFLTEKLTPRERQAFIKSSGIDPASVALWQKLEPKSKKLERELESAKLKKPSQVCAVLAAAPGDQLLFLLLRSTKRIVQDRIKNYFGKYLHTMQEVTDELVVETSGMEPGTPKFKKAKEAMVAARLDARPKKAAVVAAEAAATAATPAARGRTWGR
jgi:tRNA nucleotidyltransferase (CCA-adding enzyme)